MTGAENWEIYSFNDLSKLTKTVNIKALATDGIGMEKN